jgi:hypothetical protein
MTPAQRRSTPDPQNSEAGDSARSSASQFQPHQTGQYFLPKGTVIEINISSFACPNRSEEHSVKSPPRNEIFWQTWKYGSREKVRLRIASNSKRKVNVTIFRALLTGSGGGGQ